MFAQNIDFGYTLETPRGGAVLTSTHSLCFGTEINIPLHTPVLLYKSGVQEGIQAQTCFPDALIFG